VVKSKLKIEPNLKVVTASIKKAGNIPAFFCSNLKRKYSLEHTVIPAQTGIQCLHVVDFRLRGNDGRVRE